MIDGGTVDRFGLVHAFRVGERRRKHSVAEVIADKLIRAELP